MLHLLLRAVVLLLPATPSPSPSAFSGSLYSGSYSSAPTTSKTFSSRSSSSNRLASFSSTKPRTRVYIMCSDSLSSRSSQVLKRSRS